MSDSLIIRDIIIRRDLTIFNIQQIAFCRDMVDMMIKNLLIEPDGTTIKVIDSFHQTDDGAPVLHTITDSNYTALSAMMFVFGLIR